MKLSSDGGSTKTERPDHNGKLEMYINEAGMYKLIFRSKNHQAEAFTDWVCSKVLPFTRKHGAFITNGKAIDIFGLIHNDEAEALRRINNPRGETKLHYDALKSTLKSISPCSNHTSLRGEQDHSF